jgi:threonyl-tRNA synthetase
LEHTAGHLPLWLCPDQVKVLPVSEKYAEYAKNICGLLNNSDIRTSMDDRNETLGKRIRETSILRIPVLVIVGEKETQAHTVSVRVNGEDRGAMSVNELIDKIKADIKAELS